MGEVSPEMLLSSLTTTSGWRKEEDYAHIYD
jgi:hypothetical protein